MKLGWRFIKQLIKRNPLSAIDMARYTSFMATQLGFGFAVVDTYRELFRDNLQLLREVNERDLLTLIDILETRHADEQGSVTHSLTLSLSSLFSLSVLPSFSLSSRQRFSYSFSILSLAFRRLGLGMCPSTSHSHTHTHSLSLVLVVMIKSKELKTKISLTHSLILSLAFPLFSLCSLCLCCRIFGKNCGLCCRNFGDKIIEILNMFCVCDGVPMVNLQLMIMKLFLKPRPHLLPLVRTLKDGSKEVVIHCALSATSMFFTLVSKALSPLSYSLCTYYLSKEVLLLHCQEQLVTLLVPSALCALLPYSLLSCSLLPALMLLALHTLCRCCLAVLPFSL